MSRRPRIAILGCSFSAFDYHNGLHNWGQFLAEDNPHVDVVNFAISAHGYDYARFVLNWMVYTHYEVDLIIMNIPPLNRRFAWGIKNNHFDLDTSYDFFRITHDQENMYTARPKAPREVYGSMLFNHDDLDENNSVTPKDPLSLESYNKHAFNTQINMLDCHTSARMLPAYEDFLGCKIFYYVYHEQRPFPVLTNLELKTPPFEHLINTFGDIKLTISDTDHHLNTRGNNLFYKLYIKNDTTLYPIIRNLK